jgi:hypothetical protein
VHATDIPEAGSGHLACDGTGESRAAVAEKPRCPIYIVP